MHFSMKYAVSLNILSLRSFHTFHKIAAASMYEGMLSRRMLRIWSQMLKTWGEEES